MSPLARCPLQGCNAPLRILLEGRSLVTRCPIHGLRDVHIVLPEWQSGEEPDRDVETLGL